MNQGFSNRRIRYVRNSFAIGFDVEFNAFVFAQFALFGVLEIDASVFDRSFFVSADDFNANAVRLRLGSGGGGLTRRIVLRVGSCGKERAEKETKT